MRPFIVFEGIDGMGKGTIMSRAIDYLRSKHKDVVVTKDPGGTKLGVSIRRVMYEEVPTTEMVPGVVDLLFLASHLQNWLTVVKPALDDGKIVVCDRWWYSQAAYMTQRVVPPTIAQAYMDHHGCSAGLLIFLWGDPEASLKRARARETETHQSAKAWNDLEKLQRIQATYYKLFSNLPEFRAIWVDKKDPDQVWAEAKADIDVFMVNCRRGK